MERNGKGESGRDKGAVGGNKGRNLAGKKAARGRSRPSDRGGGGRTVEGGVDGKKAKGRSGGKRAKVRNDVRRAGGREDVLGRYDRHRARRTAFLGLLALMLLLALMVSVSVGSVPIPLADVIAVLTGTSGGGGVYDVIIWRSRVPRALTAVVAGMGLAVAGAALQSILRNPIASPFTLGISHSAAFGAAFAIVVLGAGSHQSHLSDAVRSDSPQMVTISAFFFAMLATGVIIFLARYRGATPETMILSGVAMGSLALSGFTAIEYFADDVQLASVIFWTFGDLGRVSWGELAVMAALILPSMAYFIYNSWNYNALDAGDETARSLGVDVDRVRIGGLVVACLVTSLVVSFTGIIGFVGLVVPHIVRKSIGGNERYMMPASMMGGALLLLVSDTLARTIISPLVLPVGILTSFMGAPLFLLLVIRGREHWR